MVSRPVAFSILLASSATATASLAGCNHVYDGPREAVLENQTASFKTTASRIRVASNASIADVHKERRCSGCAVVADHSEAIAHETRFEHHSRLKVLP